MYSDIFSGSGKNFIMNNTVEFRNYLEGCILNAIWIGAIIKKEEEKKYEKEISLK